jgi:TonB family protein
MKLVLIAGLALILAACAPRREAPPSVESYKRTFALDVLQHRPGAYCHPGEDMLKSVVVLDIAVDADGRLVAATVLRANGHPELAQRALETVKAAAPFTAPGQGVQFLETFLFRDDDCFLIRSLVR